MESKHMNMLLITVISTLITIVLLGSLAACTQEPTPTIEWDMVTSCAPGDEYQCPVYAWMIDEIANRTDGHFIVHLRALGEMGVPDREIPPMVKEGALESCFIPMVMFADVPAAAVTLAPFIIRDADEANEVAVALRPLFIPWFTEAGYVFIPCNHLNYTTCLWSNEPYPTIASMKGVKVRTLGPHLPKLAQEFGMEPTTVDPTEIYLALQRGVIDAAFGGHYWGTTVKLGEVCKYVNEWRTNYWHGTWIANPDAWNQLPAEWRKMITDDIAPEVARRMHQTQVRQEAELPEIDKGLGLTVVQPNPADWERAAEVGLKLANDWAANVGPRGEEALNTMMAALQAARK